MFLKIRVRACVRDGGEGGTGGGQRNLDIIDNMILFVYIFGLREARHSQFALAFALYAFTQQ